jgi:hypothetical protein
MADRYGARCLQPRHDGGVDGRVRVLKNLESLGGRRAGEVDVLLDGERNAVQRREFPAARSRLVGCRGRVERLVGKDADGTSGIPGSYP